MGSLLIEVHKKYRRVPIYSHKQQLGKLHLQTKTEQLTSWWKSLRFSFSRRCDINWLRSHIRKQSFGIAIISSLTCQNKTKSKLYWWPDEKLQDKNPLKGGKPKRQRNKKRIKWWNPKTKRKLKQRCDSHLKQPEKTDHCSQKNNLNPQRSLHHTTRQVIFL